MDNSTFDFLLRLYNNETDEVEFEKTLFLDCKVKTYQLVEKKLNKSLVEIYNKVFGTANATNGNFAMAGDLYELTELAISKNHTEWVGEGKQLEQLCNKYGIITVCYPIVSAYLLRFFQPQLAEKFKAPLMSNTEKKNQTA